MDGEREDLAIEAEVLFALLESPHQLAVEELCSVLGSGSDFAARDSVEVALRDLARVGLVHRRETLAWPGRAPRISCAHHRLAGDGRKTRPTSAFGRH
jgi:hypothetical protein